MRDLILNHVLRCQDSYPRAMQVNDEAVRAILYSMISNAPAMMIAVKRVFFTGLFSFHSK